MAARMEITKNLLNQSEIAALTELVVVRSERFSALALLLIESTRAVPEVLRLRHEARLRGPGASNDAAID